MTCPAALSASQSQECSLSLGGEHQCLDILSSGAMSDGEEDREKSFISEHEGRKGRVGG